MKLNFNETSIRAALPTAWSLKTAKQWTPGIPAGGQCNVTTVVIHDLFGGEILRTKVPGYDVDHYYNRINRKAVDFTDSQFPEPVRYDDELATREDAMQCVLDSEYETLRRRLLANCLNGEK